MIHKPMTAAELRKAVDTLGLSQVALAEFVGVSPRAMREWLAGDNAVPRPIALLVRILTRAGITPGEIEKLLAKRSRAA